MCDLDKAIQEIKEDIVAEADAYVRRMDTWDIEPTDMYLTFKKLIEKLNKLEGMENANLSA